MAGRAGKRPEMHDANCNTDDRPTKQQNLTSKEALALNNTWPAMFSGLRPDEAHLHYTKWRFQGN
jgi:hypothetical protein